jgi:hypothetical protein
MHELQSDVMDAWASQLSRKTPSFFRQDIHLRTRLFSPNPGHSQWPSLVARN